MLVLCYPKCTTCQKALAWLDAHGLSYEIRNIKEQNPTEGMVRKERPADKTLFQHQRPFI